MTTLGKRLISRAEPRSLALETTLLAHGVPRPSALPLAGELAAIAREAGAVAALIGLVRGRPVVGMTDEELGEMLALSSVPKANSANLGALMHRGQWGATSVSATMELAAAAGLLVFATGGIGGVHKGFANRWDVSADLAALARFPMAVVSSGVKSLLDVVSTREALETLGVPVIGFGCDEFPAFFARSSGTSVDARFDDVADLSHFLRSEISRTGRGVLVANPIPESDAIEPAQFERWLKEAEDSVRASGVEGRRVTPLALEALHRVSGGATLRANLSLVRENVRLGARIAAALRGGM